MNCLDCHDKCHAECCRVMSITIINDLEQLKVMVKEGLSFRMPRRGQDLTKDRAWYYKLHGMVLDRQYMTINPSLYRIAFEGNKMLLYRDCSLLEGNLCKGHPNNKPFICQELDINNPPSHERFYITPNCYANKNRGEGS